MHSGCEVIFKRISYNRAYKLLKLLGPPKSYKLQPFDHSRLEIKYEKGICANKFPISHTYSHINKKRPLTYNNAHHQLSVTLQRSANDSLLSMSHTSI